MLAARRKSAKLSVLWWPDDRITIFILRLKSFHYIQKEQIVDWILCLEFKILLKSFSKSKKQRWELKNKCKLTVYLLQSMHHSDTFSVSGVAVLTVFVCVAVLIHCKRLPENNCAYVRKLLQCWNWKGKTFETLWAVPLKFVRLRAVQNWVLNTHFFGKLACCKHYSTHWIIGSVVLFSLQVSMLPSMKCTNSSHTCDLHTISSS